MNLETQEHLTSLRHLLSYRIHELNTELHALSIKGGQAVADGPSSGEVSDRKDEADSLGRERVDAEWERLEREALRRCEAALRRLDLGVYGDCLDCEEPVPLARLLAQPDAERCAACQAKVETHGHRAAHGS